MTDEGVEHLAVDRLEAGVLGAVPRRVTGVPQWERRVLGAELAGKRGKELELTALVELHPDGALVSCPHFGSELAGIRHGLVEMHRGDVIPAVLPELEVALV